MHNIILLFLCFLIGIALRRVAAFPRNAHTSLNAFIIYVSLPALAILHIHQLIIETRLLFPMLMPWIIFGLGAIFFITLGRIVGLPEKSVGALILVGGLGNTSFVGLPMLEAFYGQEALGIGMVADQLGSFLILSGPGIIIATRYSGGAGISSGEIAKRVLLFPPMIALLAGLLTRPIMYPDWLIIILTRLGDTLSPIALISVGFQLRLDGIGSIFSRLWIGLVYKMALAPLFIFGLYTYGFFLTGLTLKVSVMEAGMPPMITAGIVAIQRELDPPLVVVMLAGGVALCFITLPLLYWFLNGFA